MIFLQRNLKENFHLNVFYLRGRSGKEKLQLSQLGEKFYAFVVNFWGFHFEGYPFANGESFSVEFRKLKKVVKNITFY